MTRFDGAWYSSTRMGRMTTNLAAIACLVALASAGCAEQRIARPARNTAAPLPASVATRPTGKAALAFDEITPQPTLDRIATRPASAPSRPSIDALVLYARARGEIQENRRQGAIRLLEQAVELDPDSYELRYTLGRAYRGALLHDERSIEQMAQAVAIEPDHLDAQLDLGRQYLSKGDVARGLEHLRLAVQTADYRAGDARAAEADLFLAHALQAEGYDRAALAQFERLIARLSDGSLRRGANVDLSYQLGGKLYLQVGDLYRRQGQPERALAAYERAAASIGNDSGGAASAVSPADDLDVEGRVARTLLELGRPEQAVSRAATAVARSRASAESLALLRDVYRAIGRESGLTAELARLHAERPGDRAILFALADLLRADGQDEASDRALAKASAASPGDAEIVRRRIASREASGDLSGAARVLVDALAREPALSGELQEPFARLLRTENRARFEPAFFVEVPDRNAPATRAAGTLLYWRAMQAWPRRSALAAAREAAVNAALEARPIFAPTLRDHVHAIWSDPNRSPTWKGNAANDVIHRVAAAGELALSDELLARSMLYQGEYVGALELLVRAAKEVESDPPDLLHALAVATRGAGDEAAFERQLTQLIDRRPLYGPAYRDLHDFHWAKHQPERAEAISAAWVAEEPNGLESRLLQAQDHLRRAHPAAAEPLLATLFRDFGDEPRVLAAMQTLYARTGRTQRLATLLEARVAQQRSAYGAAARLAALYLSLSRTADASRVLDAARDQAAREREADALYPLAHLYAEAGQPEASVATLEQTLAIDPAHASAANDLGYGLAERGQDLPRAEDLTRRAVAAEPDSPTLLDSLGWVLYKRGKFAEARDVFARALLPEHGGHTAADPVLLDHMGDACYRLGDREAADRLWEHGAERLAALGLGPTTGPATAPAATTSSDDDAAASREELQTLRLHLANKRRQLKSGGPVDVAPVVETPPAAIAPVTRPAEAGAR